VARRLTDLTIGQKRAIWAWGFLALPIAFYVAIRFYPTLEAFRASFTNWNIVGRMEYVGLANYARLVQDPAFWKVIGNTFAYLGLGVPISMLISFVIAYYLDRVRFGHGLLRALYFVPHLTTAVAMAWVWRWFYQPPPVGAFNVWLTSLGLRTDAVPALDDAGAPRRAGAGDLGRHRIPDRDLSRGPEGDPAHVL
jgi:multiple sugar transport system permease protein